MDDYIKRLRQEKEDLEDKISKLGVFIYGDKSFKNLTLDRQVLMRDQLEIMEDYLDVLEARIKKEK